MTNSADVHNHLQVHVQRYKEKINDLFSVLDVRVLEKVIQALLTAFQEDRTVFIAGNGGSAATASHIHEDFVFYSRHFARKRPRIISLTNNIAFITAISNDIGYEEIFVEQMRSIFKPGDVIIVISASGNSNNVIKAAEYAKENGGTSIAWVGFTGGKLREICDLCIHTPNAKGDYGPIEDMHLALGHLIISYLSSNEKFLGLANG